MIDWIAENPYWTAGGVYVTYAMAKGLLDSWAKRLYNESDMLKENMELRLKLGEAINLVESLKGINKQLEAQLNVYTANENLNKFNREQQARNQQRAKEQQDEASRRRQEEFARTFRNSFDGFGGRSGFDFNGHGTRGTGQQTRAKSSAKTFAEIKKKYRTDMRANHPDAVEARGGSKEEIRLATVRVQQINAQYEKDKARWKL